MTSEVRINLKSIPGKVEMWSDTDNISWMEFAQGSEITEATMQEILRLVQSTTLPGEELLALVDVSQMESITGEARTLAAGKELEALYKALAIVAISPAMKLVAKFFIAFHKPPRPTKIFTSTDEAKKWLMSFK